MLYKIEYNIDVESILKSVLEEELKRNLMKQDVFKKEFSKYAPGSLVIEKVNGCEYVYRKYRDGAKIVSEYVGPIHGEASSNAFVQRENYLKLKKDIKDLVKEEHQLRRMIRLYD